MTIGHFLLFFFFFFREVALDKRNNHKKYFFLFVYESIYVVNILTFPKSTHNNMLP